MTRRDLVDHLESLLGLPREGCRRLLNTVIEELCLALEQDGKVAISGFGTFLVRSKAARIGQNIRAGKPVMIAPRNVLVFQPSRLLRERFRQNRPDNPQDGLPDNAADSVTGSVKASDCG